MAGLRAPRTLAYISAILLVILSVVVLERLPAIEAGAAAPVLLLLVLVVARLWGIGPALVAATTASLGYSYYFLPPLGFGIENPNDWAAFITFTVTATLAGELAARAERRHLEAQAGRREIERLYQELQLAFDRASEAEAARRNEQLKAALLDALTHNLRTPLTAIKASVTALMGTGGWDPSGLTVEGKHELLQIIDEESDRLNRFIEGLSAVDRPDPSQPLSFAPVRLKDIVRAGLTRAESVTRAHRLHVTIEPDIPAVSVDPAAVAEVIYILVDNASKYSPAGTAIRIAASRESDRLARLTVTDEGPGIEPAMREQVFEKFFRIPGRDPVDSRRPNGVGLGLPIAKRLIEAQSGRIWIEAPQAGRGTTFVITLPIAAAKENAKEEEMPAPVAVSS
jgi:two-component system sensor histidine kinase KdpD